MNSVVTLVCLCPIVTSSQYDHSDSRDCKVLIKGGHRLVRTGLYERLRHLAYTGALVAHLGLGLSFSNWFSLALSVVPYFAAAMYRIRVEEQALIEAFGEEYITYARNTKRLIPKVY